MSIYIDDDHYLRQMNYTGDLFIVVKACIDLAILFG